MELLKAHVWRSDDSGTYMKFDDRHCYSYTDMSKWKIDDLVSRSDYYLSDTINYDTSTGGRRILVDPLLVGKNATGKYIIFPGGALAIRIDKITADEFHIFWLNMTGGRVVKHQPHSGSLPADFQAILSE